MILTNKFGTIGKHFGSADMMELADMLDLGSSASRRAGSTPVIRTKNYTPSILQTGRELGVFCHVMDAPAFIALSCINKYMDFE